MDYRSFINRVVSFKIENYQGTKSMVGLTQISKNNTPILREGNWDFFCLNFYKGTNMVTNVLCPLCKAPLIIQKGARKSNFPQRYQTKKSHVFCSKCHLSAKEALTLKCLNINLVN